jgi:hypothetical protein
MGEGVVVRPDQVSLGVLVNAVPRDAVDDAVAVCGVREKRSDGKLPAHVITYLGCCRRSVRRWRWPAAPAPVS